MTTMQSPLREHSKFGASGAHIWGNCPGSVQMAEHFHDDEGEEAMRGTAMHEVFAACLAEGRQAAEYVGAKITVEGKTRSMSFVVDKDAARNVQLGVDFCRLISATPGSSYIERQVAMPAIHRDMFSHLDFGHAGADGCLTIVDYKNGRLSVAAEGHWQTILYGIGCILTFAHEFPTPIRFVRLAIVQPNDIEPGPRVKQCVYPVETIMGMIPLFAEAARCADLPVPPYVAGHHCRHCRAFGACKTSRDHITYVGNLLAVDFATVDPRALKAAFEHSKLIKQRLKDLEAVATKRLAAAEPIPGMKLVTTVKHRAWSNEDAIKSAIVQKFGVDPLKCPSPAQLELYGNEAREFVQANAYTPTGEAVAALDGDKRKPYVVRTAAQIFGA